MELLPSLLLVFSMTFFLLCMIFGLSFNRDVLYGCYHDNGLNLCNGWINIHTENYLIEDVMVNNSKSCNCVDQCIESIDCNCKELLCKVFSQYKNTTYQLAHNYKIDSDTHETSFSYLWNYEAMQQIDSIDFVTNHNHNVFENIGVPDYDVFAVGNDVYVEFILFVLFGSFSMFCFFLFTMFSFID